MAGNTAVYKTVENMNSSGILLAEVVPVGKNAAQDLKDTTKAMVDLLVNEGRRICALGVHQNPKLCLGFLQGKAEDGKILEFYSDLGKGEVNPEFMARTLAQAALENPGTKIGRVSFERKGKEPLSISMGGSGAFDAGFTAGYLDGAKAEKLPHDPSILPKLNIQCSTGKGEVDTCAVIGYIQGAAAFAKKTEVAER